MNKAELEAKAAAQAQSVLDVQEVQELMKAKNIRVEARQRLNTENGFIELVAIFISEKVIDPTTLPVVAEEVKTVEEVAPAVEKVEAEVIDKTDAEHAG